MRITINLNDAILEKVDAEASKLGTSRGAMLTTWIGEKINQLEQTRAFLSQLQSEANMRKVLDMYQEVKAKSEEVMPGLFDADDFGGGNG